MPTTSNYPLRLWNICFVPCTVPSSSPTHTHTRQLNAGEANANLTHRSTPPPNPAAVHEQGPGGVQAETFDVVLIHLSHGQII